MPHDREAEADAAGLPVGLGGALLEGVEDGLVLRARNAAPAVPHDEDDGVLVGMRRDRDAARIGELRGVGAEVVQDLLEPHRIRRESRDPTVDLYQDGLAAEDGADAARDLVEQGPYVHLLELGLDLAARESRQIE